MKSCVDCVPCFIRQALAAVRIASPDPGVHEQVLREVLAKAANLDFNVPPPVMGQWVYRRIREATGNADPYREHKRRQNELALRVYPEMRRRVAASPDPFVAAVRLALAGNIIDPGTGNDLSDDEAVHTLERSLDTNEHGPADEDVGALARGVAAAGRILYIADNAGEIVLDRLLIETALAGRLDQVTVAVRGGPVINDATAEDARAAGLCDLVRVIDNGDDAPGTVLSQCSPAFRAEFDAADLVIAKGQGNYETLNDVQKPIFLLLMAKCRVVARDLGCALGDRLVWRPNPAGGK